MFLSLCPSLLLTSDYRFRSFLYAVELNPASSGLNLEAQLAKPWQRVMKYTLLLKEILKRVTVESERALVETTLHQLERTIEDLNHKQEVVDRLRIGQEKEKQYGISMCGPARSYVFDSKVKVITHNSKLAQSAVLCTDVIFLGKKKGMFSAATFVKYDLKDVLVIRYPPGSSKFFIMRLSADEGTSISVSLPFSVSLTSLSPSLSL
jgi:hypothetical protein